MRKIIYYPTTVCLISHRPTEVLKESVLLKVTASEVAEKSLL